MGGPPPLVQSWVKATQNTLHNLTVKRYCLPDKTVASQVLMYRQLLHTSCRPNLRLSRDYTGTAAQMAVRYQPWWCTSVENGQILTMVETGKMVISYDNLITRLWNTGVLKHPPSGIDTTSLPPVPDDRWIHILGFQQNDPVTDFRSGGVLSLALMVWIVESCPDTFARFATANGDAHMLPFGITSINVTDLLAKLFLLSKKTDRMEALLSQKPFWQMFNDPIAILVCQQVALDLLADVVVELSTTRRQNNRGPISVFDFAEILKITEHRVEYDLLGAGPVSVDDLRRIYQTVRRKYTEKAVAAGATTIRAGAAPTTTTTASPPKATTTTNMAKNPGLLLKGLASKVVGATSIIDKAGQATGSVFSKGNELLAKMVHTPTAAAASSTTVSQGSNSGSPPHVPPEHHHDFAQQKAPPPPPQTEDIDFFAANAAGDGSGTEQQVDFMNSDDGLMQEVDFFANLDIGDMGNNNNGDNDDDDDWVGAKRNTMTTTTTTASASSHHTKNDDEAAVATSKFQIDDDDFLL